MVPGLLQTLTPIDVESYDMDSPEMEANDIWASNVLKLFIMAEQLPRSAGHPFYQKLNELLGGYILPTNNHDTMVAK